ncbi:MAG: MMPL family transporter, partial [Candidatus Faecivicinus sp.]
DEREAMVQALCMSTGSILSSGLTTVIGFLALCLMQFQIGPDLGLVLAKGVAISLITVFVFSPALILSTHKLMEKTRHRYLLPSFRTLGKVVYRLMIPAVLVFLLLIYPANRASNSNEYYYGSAHIFGLDTQLGADTAEIEEIFGKSDTYVLMVPRGDVVRERQLSDELQELPEVTSILSYVDVASTTIPTQFVGEETLSLLMSENYSRLVLSVDADFEGAATFDLIDRVRAVAEKWYPGEWRLAGEGVSTEDLMSTVTADMTKVNFLAIAAVFLVLLFSMKSISLPVILVMAIETAIWINLSLPYFFDRTIFYIAYLIISSIQLGATVDYAILFTDRYLEFRRSMGKRDAIVNTVSAVTASILTSGMTLTVVGFLLGYLSTHGLLSQLGMFLGKGTLCSLAIVFFVLPGLLYLLDGLIRHTSLGLKLAPAKLRAGTADAVPAGNSAALEKAEAAEAKPAEAKESAEEEHAETEEPVDELDRPAEAAAEGEAPGVIDDDEIESSRPTVRSARHAALDERYGAICVSEKPAAPAESAELERVQSENARLRREIEMLKEALDFYRSAMQIVDLYHKNNDQEE